MQLTELNIPFPGPQRDSARFSCQASIAGSHALSSNLLIEKSHYVLYESTCKRYTFDNMPVVEWNEGRVWLCGLAPRGDDKSLS